MLVRNRSNFNQVVAEYTGGASFLGNSEFRKAATRQLDALSFGSKASFPDGYVSKGYAMPMKAGGISAWEYLSLSASGSGAMGVNGEATITIEFPVANADAQLIVSGLGSTSFEITSSGSVVASLSGVGSTTFSFSLNHLAMFVDAYGFALAQLNLLTSGSGTLTAKAICGGTTVDVTGLTPASIWAYKPDVALKSDVYAAALL